MAMESAPLFRTDPAEQPAVQKAQIWAPGAAELPGLGDRPEAVPADVLIRAVAVPEEEVVLVLVLVVVLSAVGRRTMPDAGRTALWDTWMQTETWDRPLHLVVSVGRLRV